MDKKARYSDEELEEFRSIINDKLKVARTEYTALMNQLMNKDGNGTDDTSPTYNKVLDEVVVVGYQEVRKRDLTGSVAKASVSKNSLEL